MLDQEILVIHNDIYKFLHGIKAKLITDYCIIEAVLSYVGGTIRILLQEFLGAIVE